MHVKVKFVEGFKDGMIFPNRSFGPGEVAVITESELQRVRSSGGVIEVVEQMIPNPLKAEKLERQVAPEDRPDPLNPDNGINDLENHIPGTKEEVEDAKAREEERRAKAKKK